jgi:hypothetical protein
MFLKEVGYSFSMDKEKWLVLLAIVFVLPNVIASTIDQFHEISEGQHLVFTERQDSWGVTWSYITTDSQPPTPTFRGIPPGVDNLGVPPGANMHKVFGYLKTDNYSTNGTNLGCILNCNITATFDWTPTYCQAIGMNYTFYNTTSNTTRKYNYHFNLLKWRSDLPFPGVPIDTIIEKFRVNNVDRPPQIAGVPSSVNIPVGTPMNIYFSVSDPDELCIPSEENASALVNFTSSPKTIGQLGYNGTQYYWYWTPTSNDIGSYLVNITATDSHGVTTIVQMAVNVGSNLKPMIGALQTVPALVPKIQKVEDSDVIPQNLNPPQIISYKPESTIDQFHELNEGQNLVFTERQDSWGVTWSYITTDSQPPTPTFRGIPPGEDNLGLPLGATMPTVFGYLKTDNYSTNGTNLGCILNCNITATFDWTPTYCQAIGMNYTFYNTTSNTTRKYNYHFNLLKWRSDLPFPGVPIDTIIEKFRVNNVDRPPTLATSLPTYKYVAVNTLWVQNLLGTDLDKTECGDDKLTMSYSASPSISASFSDQGNGSAQFSWTPTSTGIYTVKFRTTDNFSAFDEKTVNVMVYQPAETKNYNISENQFLTFQRNLTVPAGETVKIEPVQANLPAGSTFPIAQGTTTTSSTFSWTPSYCAGKSTPYSFNVNNYGSGNIFDVETININVANVNQIPNMTKIPMYASDTYNYMTQPTGFTPIDWQFTVDDADIACGDDSLGAVNMTGDPIIPSGASLSRVGSSNIYNFHYLPVLSDKGRYTFTFGVSDTKGGFVQKQMVVDIFGQKAFVKYPPVSEVAPDTNPVN